MQVENLWTHLHELADGAGHSI